MKDRDAYFELLVFLVSSAERIGREPASYAPLRLIDGALKLCGIMVEEGDGQEEKLKELMALIEAGRQKSMSDESAFQDMLSAASEKLVDCM